MDFILHEVAEFLSCNICIPILLLIVGSPSFDGLLSNFMKISIFNTLVPYALSTELLTTLCAKILHILFYIKTLINFKFLLMFLNFLYRMLCSGIYTELNYEFLTLYIYIYSDFSFLCPQLTNFLSYSLCFSGTGHELLYSSSKKC